MPHKLLSIPEISLCVAEVVPYSNSKETLDHSGQNASAKLVSLTLVSRDFKEPALDVLWRTLPDFTSLARLFPTTLVSPVLNEERGATYVV